MQDHNDIYIYNIYYYNNYCCHHDYLVALYLKFISMFVSDII